MRYTTDVDDMSNDAHSPSSGFTLIELLVVIAIIGLLASIVLTSLTSARVKARDASRAEALHQIQTAVELYATYNGHYPISVKLSTHLPDWTSFDSAGWKDNLIVTPGGDVVLSTALQPYIQGVKDPNPLNTGGGYLYYGDGNNYCVLVWGTVENMNNFPKSQWRSCTAADANGKCTAGTPNAENSVYVGAGTHPGC